MRTSFGALGVGLVLLAFLSLACGGGGSSGGGGPTTPQPPIQPPQPPVTPGVEFTPEGVPGAETIYLEIGSGGSNTIMVIDVVASDVSDLYGVSFELKFPKKLLGFRPRQTEEGEFLAGEDDAQTELIVEEEPTGNLVIGYSRIGELGGIEGSGTLFSIEFNLEESGDGVLNPVRGDIVGTLGDIQADAKFLGGDIEVTVVSDS